MKRIAMWILSIVASYLIIGLIFHHWILPVQIPDYTNYFKVGTSFTSKLEGLTQTVVQLENGKLTSEIRIEPKAAGPVTHYHENFDETFIVKQGTLSMQYEGEVKKLTAGERIVIPKHTAHRPFNETDSAVVVISEMPADFAFCLSQIYPFWDAHEANTKPPKVLFQLSVFGSKFDSFPTENAPPKPVLNALKFLLAPTARLMGYQAYNEAYKPS